MVINLRAGCPLLLVLAAAMLCSGASAHELGIARVTLEWNESGTLELHARIPAAVSNSVPTPPERCVPTDTVVRPATYGNVQVSWSFNCGSRSFESDDVLLLEWPLEGVFLAPGDGTVNGRFFDKGDERVVLPLSEILATDMRPGVSFSQYFNFGVEHILSGWDHLAFVLVLCLIAAGWRLFKLVTAFTVGHSITLGLASVGFVSVAGPPLEALIALSIAFMAREAILGRRPSQGYGIVLAFGLLHGLGFAGALSEFGLRNDSLLMALLSFNLGVESGQLIFVFFAVIAIALIRKVLQPEITRYAVAHGIGILAIFWTVERIAGFTA